MWLCKQLTTRSLPDIGRRFGGRDHTAVLHAVRRIEELRKEDPHLAHQLDILSRKLRSDDAPISYSPASHPTLPLSGAPLPTQHLVVEDIHQLADAMDESPYMKGLVFIIRDFAGSWPQRKEALPSSEDLKQWTSIISELFEGHASGVILIAVISIAISERLSNPTLAMNSLLIAEHLFSKRHELLARGICQLLLSEQLLSIDERELADLYAIASAEVGVQVGLPMLTLRALRLPANSLPAARYH
jgi:hypothetical protein